MIEAYLDVIGLIVFIRNTRIKSELNALIVISLSERIVFEVVRQCCIQNWVVLGYLNKGL